MLGQSDDGGKKSGIYPADDRSMRRAVISDWKFFLNNDDWRRLWARRYGGSAVEALADELRRFPWQERRD